MRSKSSPGLHVHVVELPRMLEDAVRIALERITTDVVAGPPTTQPDDRATVVVTSESVATRDGWCAELLRRRPDVAILAIRPGDGHGTLLELWPRRRALGRLSEERIAAAAASVVRWSDRLEGCGDGG